MINMNYTFPIITNIKDLLPAIQGKEEFIVCEKEGYSIINYVYKTDETFPPVTDYNTAVLRECRGITFDSKTGDIIRRPLHKFFNLDERPECYANNVDMNESHLVLSKLDGSQVVPLAVDNTIIWGTKMGETDFTPDISAHVVKSKYINSSKYYEFADDCIRFNVTPIFEWCSRKNRIVIDYPEPVLTLIAMRHMHTGMYYSQKVMEIHAHNYNIPVVPITVGGIKPENLTWFKGLVAEQENVEGVVIRFESGHMLKVKTSWYIRIHRAKDEINSERKVVACIVNEQIDDLIPSLVMDIDKERVCGYYTDFCVKINNMVDYIDSFIMNEKCKFTRKEYALEVAPKQPSVVKSIIFSLWNIAHPSYGMIREKLVSMIAAASTNNQNFAMIKNEVFKELVYE